MHQTYAPVSYVQNCAAYRDMQKPELGGNVQLLQQTFLECLNVMLRSYALDCDFTKYLSCAIITFESWIRVISTGTESEVQ